MNYKEIMFKIFEAVSDDTTVSTSFLKGLGITPYHIRRLKGLGYLSSKSRGVYGLDTSKTLYLRGIYHQDREEFSLAEDYFKSCYALNPNETNVSFQLFRLAIMRGNYDESFGYFDSMKDSTDAEFRKDARYYMYLLSYIIELPEKYIDAVLRMNIRSVEIPSVLMVVRKAVFNQDFDEALKYAHGILGKSQDAVISVGLLKRVIDVKENKKACIERLIQYKEYMQIKLMLENDGKMHVLSSDEKMLLLAINKILKVDMGKELKDESTMSMEEKCLLNGEFYKVLDIEAEKWEDKQNSLLVLLLNSYLNPNIQEERKEKQDTSISNSTKMYIALMDGSTNLALNHLHKYLEEIGQLRYFEFMKGHIKLALIEEDAIFMTPMRLLVKISDGEFKFDLEGYIEKLENAFYKGLYQEATIYLEIINGTFCLEGSRLPDEDTLQKFNRISQALRDLNSKQQKGKVILPKKD